MTKLTSSISICFVTSNLYDIHKILLALQQDVRTYAGNSIYGVRLDMNVGYKLAKKIF